MHESYPSRRSCGIGNNCSGSSYRGFGGISGDKPRPAICDGNAIRALL